MCNFKVDVYLEETRHNLVNVLDVVEVLSERVVDVDGHHLPVSFALVDHRKDAKDLDLEHGAPEMDN